MSEIVLERTGNVAVISLAAPQRRNAFVPKMVAELIEACNEVDADPSIGAAVLRAEGESFCAGAHREVLAEVGRDPMLAANYQALSLTYQAFVRIGSLEVPSIAAVRGHAVGAGVNLMMSTDLRIIAETASIISGFRRINVHPGGGHFVLLGRSGSREAAAALGLFGLEIDGRRAAEVGLAWESLPAERVEPRALEIAQGVATDPELARACTRSFRMELGPPVASWPLAVEAEKASQLWSLRRRQARQEAAAEQ
jgi:enoyl-CoA hydratase